MQFGGEQFEPDFLEGIFASQGRGDISSIKTGRRSTRRPERPSPRGIEKGQKADRGSGELTKKREIAELES